MHSCLVAYEDLIKGKRKEFQHPIASFFAAQGARVRSNHFNDDSLNLSDDVFLNLSLIIKSGRKQQFEKIQINIPEVKVKYYLKVANELMALNQVVIDSKLANGSLILTVFYPDILWLEAAYWNARSRTEFHDKFMDADELSVVHDACQLPQRTKEQLAMLEKALDL
ncbi:hypothetical protein N9Z70_04690 [Mariniblastus sp.]|nr:hypothetical protein [Mariniblastus sp.]